jgi:hypothetical protein
MITVAEIDNNGRGESWEVYDEERCLCVAESMDNAIMFAYHIATEKEMDIRVLTAAAYYRKDREGTL